MGFVRYVKLCFFPFTFVLCVWTHKTVEKAATEGTRIHNLCSFVFIPMSVHWNCTNWESWFGVVELITYSYGRYISVHVTQFLCLFLVYKFPRWAHKKKIQFNSFLSAHSLHVELLLGLLLNRIIHVTKDFELLLYVHIMNCFFWKALCVYKHPHIISFLVYVYMEPDNLRLKVFHCHPNLLLSRLALFTRKQFTWEFFALMLWIFLSFMACSFVVRKILLC
jgi:hypothetical protein